MYGAGIWGSSVAARDMAGACIMSMARFMLRRIEVPGESMGEFLHRLNARLQFLFDAFGIVPFEAQLIKMHLSWIGHIARTDPYSVMYRIFFWRCTAWRDGQALADLRTKYKYFNVGHPPLAPDHVAQKNFGEFWPQLASDRVLWASAVKEVIMPLIPPTLGSVPTLARLGLRVPLIAV